jgi:hypothetical protein
VHGVGAGPKLGRVGVVDADIDASTVLGAHDIVRHSFEACRGKGLSDGRAILFGVRAGVLERDEVAWGLLGDDVDNVAEEDWVQSREDVVFDESQGAVVGTGLATGRGGGRHGCGGSSEE